MANLVGSDIGLNYKGLINIGSLVNQNVSASLQFLTDGDGNNLPIQVSTTTTQLNYGVGIGVAPSSTIGLYVNGQAGTTGLAFTGASATMYIDLNGSGINFFDATQTRYRNFAGTTLAMNVWGNLGMVAIGGSATTPYTPSASLHLRGDGANSIFRADNSSGTQVAGIGSTGNLQSQVGVLELVPVSSGIYFSTNAIISTLAGSGLFIRYGAHTGMLNGITLTSNSDLPINVTSGTARAVGIISTFAATATGSANYRPLSIQYTINNTATQTGNTTGIFLNATVPSLGAMTHNLMDLQVGGSSRFSIDTNGTVNNIGGWFDNSGFTSRLYQNVLQLYNGNNLIGFMGGGGFAINTRLFVGSTVVTPVARLTARGDGTNAIGRFEHSDGTAALIVTHTPNGIGMQTSGSWVAYNNLSTQLVGIQGNIFYVFNSSSRFQIDLTSNQVTLFGRLLQSASTTTRASMNIPAGVAPTTPVNGDIWFDGTDFKVQVGGTTRTIALI
jgi:hypothetical protein